MNVKIKAVGIYHPKKVVGNDVFIEHFKQKGRDISNLLKVLGRKERYQIDNSEENTLTMGIEATKNVLKKAKMTGKDIDMIVFSTQVPETTIPTNAMFLHHAIEAETRTMTMDSNANCAGMMVAVEQASRYLMSNPHMTNALVVGSDYNSLVANPEEEITYANFGDAAVAVILEKTNEDTGFMDSIFFTDSVNKDKILFPSQGLSGAVKDIANEKNIKWLPFNGDIALPPTYNMLEELLGRNNLKPGDIKAYCLSQFALGNILKIQEHLKLDDNQLIFVGDRFGYTGTSSPFLALHEGIESGQINRGDYVVFWTVGGGYQLVAMLIKY